MAGIETHQFATASALVPELRAIISAGVSGRDQYLGNTISNSPGAHIGPYIKAGLDEGEARRQFASLLEQIERDAFARSLRDYFEALRNYSGSAYQVLASRFPSEISLEDVYVPLRGSNKHGAFDTVALSDALRSTLRGGGKHILIEGNPGAGKSTLLRQIARHAWNDPETVGLDRPYIALPIRLRSYAHAESASREDRILRAIGAARDLDIDGMHPPAGFLQEWPRQMEASWLFLLDGFDEVPEDKRDRIIEWLRSLRRENATLILTSRPTQHIPNDLRDQFAEFQIQPFSHEQQQQLAFKWLGPRAQEFQSAFSRLAKGELGGTPLLLTIAAIVYYSSDCLPSRRSELYRVFVEDGWKEALARGAKDELGELCELAPMLIPTCLKHLAYIMTTRQDYGAALDFGSGMETLSVGVSKLLKELLDIPDAVSSFRAKRIVDFLGTRSTVFRTTAHQSEWFHPTFREYLAAAWIVERCSEKERRSILERFEDPAWRQVALFIISILSENRPVVPELALLKDMSPPYGAAFVGTAIAEGADVDSGFAIAIVRSLCEDIRANAGSGTCERALTPGDTGNSSRKALVPLIGRADFADVTSALKNALLERALAYGRTGSSAVADLQQFQAHETLARIAGDVSAPLAVRADAAGVLYEVMKGQSGHRLFAPMIETISRDPSGERPLAHVLARIADAELLASLSEILPDMTWSELLDQLRSNSRFDVLTALLTDPRLSGEQTLAVQLRTIQDATVAADMVRSLADRPDLVKVCFDAIISAGDRAILVRFACDGESTAFVRRSALRGLEKLEASDEAQSIVADSAFPYPTRRRAAEIVFRLPLGADAAARLLSFFNALGRMAERPRILSRRAHLSYVTGRENEALELYDALASVRPLVGFEIGGCAHCLELLGRRDEALAAYGKAIEGNPHYAFARLRRAYLLWQDGEEAKALADVEQLYLYSVDEWFLPYGGDILLQNRRFDDAERWLALARGAVGADQSYADAFSGVLAYQQGYFQLAIDRLRSALQRDSSYRWARIQLGSILRAAEKFSDAAVELELAMAGRGDDEVTRNELTEVLISAGRYAEAGAELDNLRVRNPDEPYYTYIFGLLKAFQGDHEQLRASAGHALDQLATQDQDSTEVRANKALFLLVLGRTAEANEIHDRLLGEGALHYLQFNAYSELCALTAALPSQPVLAGTRDRLKSLLWPLGCGLAFDHRRAALQRLKRRPYPFPTYCPFSNIEGLEEDKELAIKVLGHDASIRTMVIWNVDQPNRLFGACNFKQRGASHDLKFCDATDTVISKTLPILVRDYDLRRILFLEPELMQRFADACLRGRFAVECSLGDLSV